MSKMCRFLRYCVSHCLHAAMTRLEEVNGEVSVWSSVRWLGYVSGLNLLIALCLGLYVRWEKTEESTILVIFVLALIDRPGNSQYIALFLQHGESEPESAAPVVWVFVGTAVFYQQQRSEKRREGGGGQLPDAGQYGPEDSVGAVGEALRLHQVHTYFNQENMIKVLDTILCTDSKPLHHL